MVKIFFTFFLVAFSQGAAFAQDEERESNLKAAFIYNFTKYIDWDPATEQSEFVIGVVGTSKIANALTELARVNLAKNKRIAIRFFNSPEEIQYCNILFISEKNSFPLQSVLSKATKGMLCISEQPGYAKEGTAFNFVQVNEKLKFEANLKAINAAGLKASSQLLKLAIIVD